MTSILWAMAYGALANVFSQQPVTSTVLSSTSLSERSESPVVQIWDHVFQDSALQQVKQAGNTRSHGFTSVIDRQDTDAPRTPLETALLAILDQLEAQDEVTISHSSNAVDATFSRSTQFCKKQRFVEYWWRDKVRMLEVHRDIDEEYNKRYEVPTALGSSEKVGLQRCPTFGHVLYVDMVGNFLAPTLVWKEQGEPKVDADSGTFLGGPPRTLESLSVVPSVSNRLLRFRGDCLHAVGYPVEDLLVSLSSFDEGGLLTVNRLPTDEHLHKARTPTRLNDTQRFRREVLLFNTWEVAPIYPPVDTKVRISNFDPNPLLCKRFEEWKKVPPSHFLNAAPNPTSTFSIPLLGGPSRRGCPEEFLVSLVDQSAAHQALSSRRDVHCLSILTPDLQSTSNILYEMSTT